MMKKSLRAALFALPALLLSPSMAASLLVSSPQVVPILKGAEFNPLVCLESESEDASRLPQLSLRVQPASCVKELRLIRGSKEGFVIPQEPEILARATPDEQGNVSFKSLPIPEGESFLWLDVQLKDDATVGSQLQISEVQARIGEQTRSLGRASTHRIGQMVAFCDDEVTQLDGCLRRSKDFRIPGLITTKAGTLIGSFDARYDGWVDLCADIDVATVRSTDGGQTWSKPRVSLDIGQGDANGCGDACIVQDDSGRIWLQALGVHFNGGRANRLSQTGYDFDKTTQWYMTTSDDDGQTWSRELINATKALKKEEWNGLLAGPGRGLVLRDGTIVFPAQFWMENPRRYGTSMLCYSKDGGATWQASKPSFPNASEAQVVELTDGSIMINCRAGKGQGARSVYTTKDLGETWEQHESHAKALSEPSCQASLLAIDSKRYGRVLLFSNPVSTQSRSQMSVRYSLDEGKTWQAGLEYDSRVGGGYSCLTMVDEETVGLFYESSQGHGSGQRYLGIAFLRIPLKDIIEGGASGK